MSGCGHCGKASQSSNNDCLGQVRSTAGPCLIGEEHILSRPGWGLSGCEAGRAGPRCLAVGKAGRTIPGRPSPRNPFLVAAGFTGSGTLCIPPLTVGDPTLRTGRAEPRHFGSPPTRATMRTPQRTWFPPHHQATSPWPAPTFPLGFLPDSGTSHTQADQGQHQGGSGCRRPVPVPKSCATSRCAADRLLSVGGGGDAGPARPGQLSAVGAADPDLPAGQPVRGGYQRAPDQPRRVPAAARSCGLLPVPRRRRRRHRRADRGRDPAATSRC